MVFWNMKKIVMYSIYVRMRFSHLKEGDLSSGDVEVNVCDSPYTWDGRGQLTM